jgi:hypothetical protein
VQLLALGILGEYVGRTYAAIQGRPTYFVAHDSLDGGRTTPEPHIVPLAHGDDPAPATEPAENQTPRVQTRT